MKLFALYLDLLLFYTELFFGFWITWILKRENPKIELFPPSANMALEKKKKIIYIYIQSYLYKHSSII